MEIIYSGQGHGRHGAKTAFVRIHCAPDASASQAVGRGEQGKAKPAEDVAWIDYVGDQVNVTELDADTLNYILTFR